MLVLTRKPDQQIQIGDNIKITVVRVKGQSVRIGIEAPTSVRVMRTELTLGESALTQPATAAEATPPDASSTTSCQSTKKKSAATPTANVDDNDEEGRRNPLAPQHGRIPGASHSSLVRRPQRLGPVVFRSMAGRF